MRFEPGSSTAGSQIRQLLVCFSHLRWNFVYQRPQHLLSRAAEHRNVVFFEEPIFEDIAEPRLEMQGTEEGVTVAVPILPWASQGPDAIEAQRRLLDNLIARFGGGPEIAWYYTPMALSFSGHLQPAVIVYDNMDELSAFRGAPPEMIAMEELLFQRAHVVFTGGQSLYEAKRGRHRNLHAFPSSIDKAHFGRARASGDKPLPDQDHLARPRLGYFGVIDERMDIELLWQAAEQRSDWQFIMIGPVVKIDPSALPRMSNIHWLGPKNYHELPDYLAGWDVGIMPFALNESTRFISPTKTPEFLAAGVPVVSTAIEDVIRPYGELRFVEIADGAEDFVDKAEYLLRRQSQRWLNDVDQYLATISWDNTWSAMLSHIEKVNHRAIIGSKTARREVANV